MIKNLLLDLTIQGKTYKIIGIVVHTGNAKDGHYITYYLNNNIWFRLDDDTITELDVSTTPEDLIEHMNMPEHCNEPTPFILYYELIDDNFLAKDIDEINTQIITNVKKNIARDFIPGLPNINASCYFNSITQILLLNPYLYHLFKQKQGHFFGHSLQGTILLRQVPL